MMRTTHFLSPCDAFTFPADSRSLRPGSGVDLRADQAGTHDQPHPRFEVRRVNPSQAYSADNALTNRQAQSVIARFRRLLIGTIKVREKVISEGSLLPCGKPQMRRNARSIVSRSISPTVVANPNTALATKAFANQARSKGGHPTPHHDTAVNSSIRTHSRMWITRSCFGVRAPQVLGISSRCTTFHRSISRQAVPVLSFLMAGVIRVSTLQSCQKWRPATPS
jgi:hypothetical protein